MTSFIQPLTPEERADLEARENQSRDDATAWLRATLIDAGLKPGTVDLVLPVLVQKMQPRIERVSGVLSGGGLLLSPGWYASQDRDAVRDYFIVRLSSGWIEQ